MSALARTDTELSPPALTPSEMISFALKQGMNMADLKQLFDMQERWETQQAAKAFSAALCGFQAEMPTIFKRRTAEVKTSTGGSYTYKFESFDDVMREASPVLAKYGIVVTFNTEQLDNPPRLKILVRIRVGSFFEDKSFSCPVPTDVKISEPQKFGQALSYAKRYALKAALNIVSTDQEDNDAQGLFEFITKEQAAQLKGLIEEAGADLERFLAWADCESVEQMPAKTFAKAADLLRRKRKAVVS